MRMQMLTVAALALALAACGPPQLEVTLSEWHVMPQRNSVKAGPVEFTVVNEGKEVHELVILRTDRDVENLPLNAQGAVDLTAAGEVVDEIEDIKPGATRYLLTDLPAGRYALICNLVEQEAGKTESHYQEGMRALLRVEG